MQTEITHFYLNILGSFSEISMPIHTWRIDRASVTDDKVSVISKASKTDVLDENIEEVM